jgi:sensor histidine kinase YesM
MFQHKLKYLFIALLGLYSYFNATFSEVFHYYPIQAPWIDVITAFILITYFVWEGNVLIEKVLNKFRPKLHGKKFLILFFLAGSVFAIFSSLCVIYAIAHFVHHSIFQEKVAFKLGVMYAGRINLFLHIINAIWFYVQQNQQIATEKEALQKLHAQVQLQAIQNQINPHFLFNVLSSMIMQENPNANEFIEAFSEVYRYLLKNAPEEQIELKKELNFIDTYLFLLKNRFPNSVIVSIKIPEKYLSYRIVPVSLQLLVENAIKHNIVSPNKPLYINISILGEEMLNISNNLQTKHVKSVSSNIGLNNIEKRYALLTGKKVEVIRSEDIFSVNIPLLKPKMEE